MHESHFADDWCQHGAGLGCPALSPCPGMPNKGSSQAGWTCTGLFLYREVGQSFECELMERIRFLYNRGITEAALGSATIDERQCAYLPSLSCQMLTVKTTPTSWLYMLYTWSCITSIDSGCHGFWLSWCSGDSFRLMYSLGLITVNLVTSIIDIYKLFSCLYKNILHEIFQLKFFLFHETEFLIPEYCFTDLIKTVLFASISPMRSAILSLVL